MTPLFLAIALHASLAPKRVHCGVREPAFCRDTNELVWDDSFGAAVRRFVGPRRASYLGFAGSAADQILSALGGPPDPPSRIGRFWRFTACRWRSCGEKGAAVLEPDGRLVAAAILHSACGEPGRGADCFAHDTLTIFLRQPIEGKVVANLTDWARSEIVRETTSPGVAASRLDAVEVETVRSSALAARTPASCEDVRGRMIMINGTPSVRIWLPATQRLLGVIQQDETYRQLPRNLRVIWGRPGDRWRRSISGDFRVCPLTERRRGEMQRVRVAAARRLKVVPVAGR